MTAPRDDAGVPRADRRAPARAAGALLPDPRLGPGRGGPRAGDAAGRLARPDGFEGRASLRDLAVPDRHQPLPQRAARSRPAARACPRRRTRPRAAGADAPRRADLAPAVPGCAARGSPTRRTARRPATRRGRRSGSRSSPALQRLPPRQRAVLVLRDVLGFRAGEVAEMLDSDRGVGEQRAAARARGARAGSAGRPSARRCPARARERELVARFADGFEAGDVDGVVALLTDDAWLTMPPEPLEYQGPAAIAGFLSDRARRRRARPVPPRADARQRPAGVRLLPRATRTRRSRTRTG